MKILPLKQKRLEVTIHAISWLLVFLFPILLMEWGSRMDWAQYLRHSIVPLCCFLMFYANYLYLVPRYLFRNEVGWFLLFNVVFVVGLAWILQFGHRAPFEPPRPDFVAEGFPGPPPPREWFAWGRHLVMLAFVAGLSTAIRVSLRWRHTEERLVQAERFIRVHRSFIVQKSKIKVIDRGRIVFQKDYIPVSDSYKQELQNFISEHSV